jgi:dihydrolipoamide dehydrogenase
MDRNFDFDAVVIGAGPGGYVAAIRASQLGLKACVIEKDKPGGVCLNIGCIPSKSLIHQAEVYRSAAELEAMGVKVDRSGFDYANVFKKSRLAADTLSKGVAFLLKKNKIEYVQGTATLKGPNEVAVQGGKTISGKSIVVATGSRPRVIPGFEFDGQSVLSSDHALMLERLPKSVLILGGGFIGVEFAHVMAAFGVKVTVVELLDRILPLEDAESSSVLARSFKKRGIALHTSTKALSMEKGAASVRLKVQPKDGEPQTLEAEKLLVVVGRAPNTEGIGLENVGIATEKGFIPVGDFCRTKVPSIFAIGDVVPTPQLAHVAFKEAEIVAEYLAGHGREAKVDLLAIPSAVYCEPQVASFGYKEWQAQQEGVPYKKASFPIRGAGKSVAVERTEGMVKILFNPETHEIIGAHVTGADATELIHEILLAKTSELLPEDVATMIHAHPTISEAVMEAMKSVDGLPIHV